MLERVAADDVVERENLSVGSFKDLSENIKAEDDGEVAAALVFRR